MTQCILRGDAGRFFDYTPGSAVTAGDVVEFGNVPMVAPSDIAANVLGALDSKGIYDVPKITASTFAVGALCYWDNDGDPIVGTAGTGCITSVSASNYLMGIAEIAAGATDQFVRVRQVVSPT